MAFLAQNARNISFVINQEELCDNVLSVDVMEQLGFKREAAGVDHSVISDFTLLDFQYLVVLMTQGRVVVFDCSLVLEGSARQVRYVNKDEIKPLAQGSTPTDDASSTTKPSEGGDVAGSGSRATGQTNQ